MLPSVEPSRFDVARREPFAEARRELDELFNGLFGGGGSNAAQQRAWYTPVCMWEDENHFYLEAETPGVARDDINITLEQGVLYLHGERKLPETGRKWWYNERRYGQFQRAVQLPESVDPDSIEAHLENGVLHLKLAKKPQALSRRIEVKEVKGDGAKASKK